MKIDIRDLDLNNMAEVAALAKLLQSIVDGTIVVEKKITKTETISDEEFTKKISELRTLVIEKDGSDKVGELKGILEKYGLKKFTQATKDFIDDIMRDVEAL